MNGGVPEVKERRGHPLGTSAIGMFGSSVERLNAMADVGIATGSKIRPMGSLAVGGRSMGP